MALLLGSDFNLPVANSHTYLYICSCHLTNFACVYIYTSIHVCMCVFVCVKQFMFLFTVLLSQVSHFHFILLFSFSSHLSLSLFSLSTHRPSYTSQQPSPIAIIAIYRSVSITAPLPVRMPASWASASMSIRSTS